MTGAGSGPGQDSAAVTVLSTNTILSNTEIKTLPIAPVIIVDALPGTILRFISATLVTDVTAGAYGNVTGRQLYLGWGTGPSSLPVSGSIDAEAPLGGVTAPITFDTLEPVTSADQDINDVIDKPLSLFVFGGTGNFTDGNSANSLQVSVTYTVIEAAS